MTSWPDDSPFGNQKRLWRDSVKRGVVVSNSATSQQQKIAHEGKHKRSQGWCGLLSMIVMVGAAERFELYKRLSISTIV
jgi:hypothetical protein